VKLAEILIALGHKTSTRGGYATGSPNAITGTLANLPEG
jgi:hypothetical protein